MAKVIQLGEFCPKCGRRLIIVYPKPEEPRPSDWDSNILGITACCGKKICFYSPLISPASNLVGRKGVDVNGQFEVLFRARS